LQRERLRRLAAWGGWTAAAQVSAADVVRYLAKRKAAGLGPSGLGVAICAARSFFAWSGSDAAGGLTLPRVPARVQRSLSHVEAQAVLCSLDTSTIAGKRDLALVGLLLASGLRASEVCRLRLADMDLAGRVLVVVVKGGQQRFGVFDEYAASLVQSWLSVRPLVALPETSTVFVALRGVGRGLALTREGLKCLCRRWAARAGVPHFSPHALRRTFATLATAAGCPSRVLQAAGRWSDLAMVERYTRSLDPRAFDSYSPLALLMK